tara:strand:+ start:1487 stop:1588 length:102 start_codon:yes stop_codon:yes gene_type:complete
MQVDNIIKILIEDWLIQDIEDDIDLNVVDEWVE